MAARIDFKRSRKSDKDYFLWRKVRAKEAVSRLEKYTSLDGQKILDIGCGYGSLSSLLAEKKAKVIGLDNDEKSLAVAKKFVKQKNVSFRKGIAEKLPFKDQQFDLVFLFDVIEHVKNPGIAIKEACRVLKPGGFLYVEFTPYYSLIGHHLYDITVLPIHFLPKYLVHRIVFRFSLDDESAKEHWANFESLNKLKISQFQNQIRKLILKKELFLFKYPNLFEINLPVLNKLGTFKDLFCFSYIGIFQK